MSDTRVFLQSYRTSNPYVVVNATYTGSEWPIYTSVTATQEAYHSTAEYPLLINLSRWAEDVARSAQDYLSSITKEDIDGMLTDYISFSSYYAASALVKHQVGSSFGYNVAESMGFKVFAATVNPFIEQAVEAYTDMQWTNAKYVYYSTRCWLEIEQDIDCASLENPYAESFEVPSSFLEVSWFNSTQYMEDVTQNLEGLTLQDVTYSGVLSAVASQIRNDIYDSLALTPYTQGYFFKNWISPYFKDWIKSELKHEISAAKDRIEEMLEQGYALLEQYLPYSVSEANAEALNVTDVLQQPNAIEGLLFEMCPISSVNSTESQSEPFYLQPLMMLPAPKIDETYE